MKNVRQHACSILVKICKQNTDLLFVSYISVFLHTQTYAGLTRHDMQNSGSSQCSTTGVTKDMVCAILSRMVHIKEPLLLLIKSNPSCGGSVFPLSLPEWSLTIYLTSYNRK